MEQKNKNVMIVSIIALVLVLIGVTYAYFSARITGLESASTISLTAGRMGIVYSEGDENVTVSGIYPRSEEWLTKTITLTGYNTTDQDMKYDLGINITTNTFKGGQLSFSLSGVGSNGTKIADITNKAITKTSGFFKIGTGTFSQSNGDTHVYTLKIYFKDNGKDQNFNQGAVFNGKIHVREQGSQVAKANQNHNGKHCYTDNYVEGVTPANGTTYVNGEYTYKYNMNATGTSSWTNNTSQNGWGVMLTNKNSTSAVTTELCAYINEQPVVNMSYMFNYSKATSIDLSSFDTSNVISMNHMFDGVLSVTNLNLSTFDTSNVTNMAGMFEGVSVTSLDLSSFDTSNVTDMSQMFLESEDLTNVNLSSFDTSNVTDMSAMFDWTQITNLDLSNFDTSSVTDMSTMFYAINATSIDISGFDTSNVTDMSHMFANSSATSLDLSSFNTSNVTNMFEMFAYCSVTNLDLSGFDTSNVTDMESMFYTTSAIELDLSSFDTSKVTNMNAMFSESANLSTIYVSERFVTTSVTTGGSMFFRCNNLVGSAGTTYSASKSDYTYAHIDGGPSNPGYFTAK